MFSSHLINCIICVRFASAPVAAGLSMAIEESRFAGKSKGHVNSHRSRRDVQPVQGRSDCLNADGAAVSNGDTLISGALNASKSPFVPVRLIRAEQSQRLVSLK